MILFAEDWKRYPTAIIHVNTSNKSFLRLAAVYRSMGVLNHAFLLALVNPELEFVDPYSPDLTSEQMDAINTECAINPWYFFRECVRVPPAAGSAREMLEANRGNIALFWCFFNHIMTILIQPRQTGKSFNSDVLDALLLNVLCVNTQINLLTKDDGLRRKNIERLRSIINELPRYINKLTKADSTNFEEITVKALGNTYTGHVPQQSPKAAYKVGRGLTTAISKFDEVPFQPNVEIAVGSALGSTGAAVDAAIANNEPYGTIFTTTAGKLNDESGLYMYNLLSEATIWDEKVFDCKNYEELVKFVKKNNPQRNYRMNLTFNHRQLGKTDDWLFEKISASTQKGEDADRDYFNRWTTGTSSSPISAVHLKRLGETQRSHDYAHVSPPYDYMTKWYIPADQIADRMNNSRFVAGLDTSDGSSEGDGIELVMVDVNTGETICTGSFNELNLIEFSYFLCDFLVTFKNVTLVIERRSSGPTIIDFLLKMLPVHGIDPFKRLYNTVVQNAPPGGPIWNILRMPVSKRNPNIYIEYKTAFGFTTSGGGITSRTELYTTTLQRSLTLGSGSIYCVNLVNQLCSLVTKNGRVDHPPGGHDDAVIAWLIAYWLLLNGSNLSYYGINSVLTLVKVNSETGVSMKIADLDPEQKRLRMVAEEITRRLEECDDNILSMRYESDLSNIVSRIVSTETEDWSVDSLIKRIKEKKANKRKNRNNQPQGVSPIVSKNVLVTDRPVTFRDFV